jgi:hypothetical protein
VCNGVIGNIKKKKMINKKEGTEKKTERKILGRKKNFLPVWSFWTWIPDQFNNSRTQKLFLYGCGTDFKF